MILMKQNKIYFLKHIRDFKSQKAQKHSCEIQLLHLLILCSFCIFCIYFFSEKDKKTKPQIADKVEPIIIANRAILAFSG